MCRTFELRTATKRGKLNWLLLGACSKTKGQRMARQCHLSTSVLYLVHQTRSATLHRPNQRRHQLHLCFVPCPLRKATTSQRVPRLCNNTFPIFSYEQCHFIVLIIGIILHLHIPKSSAFTMNSGLAQMSLEAVEHGAFDSLEQVLW